MTAQSIVTTLGYARVVSVKADNIVNLFIAFLHKYTRLQDIIQLWEMFK